MSRDTFIERTILSYYTTVNYDGVKQRIFRIFGTVWGTGIAVDGDITGFDLTLFELNILQKSSTVGKSFDIKTIPLMSVIVGKKIDAEIEHPEDALSGSVGGHEYTITPWTRFNAYSNIKRFYHISESVVYSISSPTDTHLESFTFTSQEWDGRRPSFHEAVNMAHDLADTLAELRAEKPF